MPYESFEEVSELASSTQYQLLVGGSPPERVWAAWSLALHDWQAADAEIERQAKGAPDRGTRRHLIVVLAGRGKTELIGWLARLDPDEYVRATAMQYLLRISDDPAAGPFAVERFRDEESHKVKRSIMEYLPDDGATIPYPLVVQTVVADSIDSREAAIAYLLSHYTPPALDRGSLVETLASPAAISESGSIVDWFLSHSSGRHFFEVISQLPDAALGDYVQACDLAGRRFETGEAMPLLKRGDAPLRVIRILCPDYSREFVDWAIGAIGDALPARDDASSQFYDSMRPWLINLFENDERLQSVLDVRHLPPAGKIRKRLEAEVEFWKDYSDEWDEGLDEPTEDDIRTTENLIARIDKWLSRFAAP